MLHTPTILLFTGHLLDSVSRPARRFPYALLDEARSVLKAEVDNVMQIHKPEMAVSSLAAGGDMIFAQEMLDRKIPLIVFLPFDVEKFLHLSVTYEKSEPNEFPEQWASQFHNIIEHAQKIIVTGTSNNSHEDDLTLCNEKMLAYALEYAYDNPQKVLAFALIQPDNEIKKGGASEFVKHIKERGVPVKQIWPNHAGEWSEALLIDKLSNLEALIPPFAAFEAKAIDNQRRWKSRFHVSLSVLATIAFFDAFVTSPDHFLFGYGAEVRIFSLISSVLGAFITLRLQVSDKTRYRNWTENRAKVEQIRSEIWYFLFDLWSENNKQGSYTLTEFKSYIGRLDKSDNPDVIDEKLLEQNQKPRQQDGSYS